MYYAGWDGGGTKTSMELRGSDGKKLGRHTSGPLNYNSCEPWQVRETALTLLKQMAQFGPLEEYGGLCIAAAGVSNQDARTFLEATLREGGYTGRIWIVGDQEAALRGAVGRQPGMVLVSGTGSICFGKNAAGETHRAGGRGHLIDDEGSGYAIGRDILSSVVRQADGRMQKTGLYDAVMHRLGAHCVEDVVHYVYKNVNAKQNISALAPLLSDAWEQGDPAAVQIADKAGQELASLAAAVAERLSLQSAVLALTGSVLDHCAPVRECLGKALAQRLPELQLICARQDAAAGAALLAMDLCIKGGNDHA